MDLNSIDIKDPEKNYSIDPDNIPLHQRPSISIRAKVAVSFSLFFILSFTVTG